MAKQNKRIKKYKEPTDITFIPRFLSGLLRGLRIFFMLSITLGAIGAIGYFSVNAMQHVLNRPVSTVTIVGEFSYVDKEEVALLVQKMIGSSFVGEDIEQIKKNLEAEPWIDWVSLSRQWPDRLQVMVKEQTPIARWSDSGFINVRGEFIATNDTEKLQHLSELSGEKSEAQIIMQQYSVLANLFQPYDLYVESLKKDRRGAWQLSLDNGWQLVLGRGDILRKVQRLTHLFDKKLLVKTADVSVVDIRYPNGLAIKWGDSDKNLKPSAATMRYGQDVIQKRG
jgi:cell division protein FtsQ